MLIRSERHKRKLQQKILNQLRGNKGIVLLTPDKSNGVVIPNKGILDIIGDSNKE